MENFALIALAEQLKPAMADLTIRRVIQHQPHGFIFQTRSARFPALKILMNAVFPAIYASESKPPLEAEGSDFLMVLRKHLTSAELAEFRKPLSERILEFKFRTVVPSKDLATMTLVLEMIPNAPNIILLDMERRVLASFLPVSPQHEIAEYEAYATPSIGDKIALERLLTEEFPALDDLGTKPHPAQWLISQVAGLGPVFAGEIVHRQRKSGRSTTTEIRSLLEQLTMPSSSAWIYTELPMGHVLEQNDLRLLERAIVSPIELQSVERSHSSRTFNTFLEATQFYFDETESRTLLERAKLPIVRELRTASKRLADREKKLIREQKKYEEAGSLMKTAQMLTSSGMKMDQRYEAADVTDYNGDKPAAVRIDLDSTITLRENIDRMFKRHHKAGRGRLMVEKQLGDVRSRLAAATEQTRRLNAIRDWDTWLAIANRIQKEQDSSNPGGPAVTSGAPRQKRFRSVIVDGREILVGRSSRENDELTFQMATPDDFWLHAGDYSGSHVVIRNPEREKDPPENVLTKAAQLAAYFSQARNSSKVEVHYTRRKHVSKPRKAKPGLVRLMEFKSIAVEPRNWFEK
ncbi:MAG TPA: NFACT family protein [Terriglobia bacterium]|nr:NFACT family protein [Terriglobia bacterium]